MAAVGKRGMRCFLSVLNSPKKLKITPRMKPISLLLLGLLLGPLAASAADAPKGFDTNGVDFYLPQTATAGRVSLDDLATYTNKLQDVCAAYFANSEAAEDLDIDVAVRPGPESRVWLVSLATPPADKRLADLRAKLLAVVPPPVHDGPVALSIHGVIAGGNDDPPTKPGKPPQLPGDWQTVILRSRTSRPVTFDEMLNLVWNGPPAAAPVSISNYLGIAVLLILGVIIWIRYRRQNR
jgi:hypothetical protein